MTTETPHITPQIAALREAAEIVGSQAAIAYGCGYDDRRNVAPWFRGAKVPAEHCPTIERMTGGAVRCERIRPDVDWQVLRNSRNRKASRQSQPEGQGA